MSGYYTDTTDSSFDSPFELFNRNVSEGRKFQRNSLKSTVRSFRTGRRAGGPQSNADIFKSARDSGSVSSFDTGHEFESRKENTSFSHPNVDIRNSVTGAGFKGTLVPFFQGSGLPSDHMPPVIPMNIGYYGAQAINSTYPTKPVAGFSQFAGELDRLPSIWLLKAGALQSKVDFFRETGSGYLNLAFGWKPFVTDIEKLCKSVLQSSNIIDQYLRDSGKNVRRRFDFDPVRTIDTRKYSSSYGVIQHLTPPPLAGYIGKVYAADSVSQQECIRTRVSTETYWFSGAYTYAVPEHKMLLDKIKYYEQLANKLLGTRLTPDVLYELMPWSWLIDWFVTLGTLTQNAVAFQNDQLVLRYGYLMRTLVQKDIYTVSGVKFVNLNPGVIVRVNSVTTKSRVRSTPYGFGLNPNTFSVGQWSILAALGMTKAPRSLR